MALGCSPTPTFRVLMEPRSMGMENMELNPLSLSLFFPSFKSLVITGPYGEIYGKCFLPLNSNLSLELSFALLTFSCLPFIHGHTEEADPCSSLTGRASDFCQSLRRERETSCVPGSVLKARDNQGRLSGPWACTWGEKKPVPGELTK